MKHLLLKPYIILFAILTLCLSGCRSVNLVSAPLYDTLADRYIGIPSNSIIQEWGAPIRITPDGEKGCVLVYEKNSFQDSPFGASRLLAKDIEKVAEDADEEGLYGTYAQFFINEEGQCYKVLTDLAVNERTTKFSLGKTLGLTIPLSIVGIIQIINLTTRLSQNSTQ